MSVKKTVLLEDNKCDGCGKELPKGSEVVVDDEVDMVFCDQDCCDGYFEDVAEEK